MKFTLNSPDSIYSMDGRGRGGGYTWNRFALEPEARQVENLKKGR